MSEEENTQNTALPLNKDPVQLRLMLKKVTGKNQKLKDEVIKLKQNLLMQETTIRSKTDIIIQMATEKDDMTKILENVQSKLLKREDDINNKNNIISQKDSQINKLRNEVDALKTKLKDENNIIPNNHNKNFEEEQVKLDEEKKRILMEISKEKKELERLREDYESKKKVEPLTEELRKELKEKSDTIESERAHLEIQQNAFEALRQKYIEDVAELENARTEFEIEKAQAELALQEAQAIQKRNADLMRSAAKQEESLELKRTEIENELRTLQSLRDEIGSKKEEFDMREAKLKDMEKIKEEYILKEQEYTQKLKEIETMKAIFENKAIEMDKLQNSLQTKNRLYESMNIEAQKKMDQLLMREEQLNKTYATTGRERDELNNRISALQSQLSEAQTKFADKENELQKMKLQCEEYKKENSKIEAENQKLKAKAESADVAVLSKQLAEAKEKIAKHKHISTKLLARIDKLEAQREDALKSTSSAALDEVHASYLKKSIMQFFLADSNRTRAEMIPALLSIVGCDEEIINMSVKKWSDSHNLLSQFK